MSLLTLVRHRSRMFAALATMSVTAAACGDDDDDDGPTAPGTRTTKMRITVGAQTIDIGPSFSLGGPMMLTVGSPATVTVQWLRSDGTPDPDATPSQYELFVTVDAGTSVTFTRASGNAFSGTLTATGPVTAGTLRFSLRESSSEIDDFGPYQVIVSTTGT